MKNKLLIVESPAKAKTIKKYLGKGYEVASSFGHIADLPEDEMGIDLATFQPKYIVPKEKKKVVEQLKKQVKQADEVYLASDEDREGEAIAWHLQNVLDLKGKAKRIVFHEITKKAVTEAINRPRDINYHLVDAQQARRILDRLVGYKLSPVLWKKIKKGLSAGRVQSVAVRLIVEREKEIKTFKPSTYFKVSGQFESSVEKDRFKADVEHKFEAEEEVKDFFERLKEADFRVTSVEKKPGKKVPPAPFTTSTLQQEASRMYGFSVSKTMQIAQHLYENGYITYMRTDSVHLSDEAIRAARKVIVDKFGEKYSRPFQYKTKSKNAQEAHEAIRPTSLENENPPLDRDALRLYQLIWKRTLASQMAPAELEHTVVTVEAPQLPYPFKAKGKVILFDGFLRLYQTEDKDTESQQTFKVQEGEKVTLRKAEAVQKFTKPPVRYTEASLVRKMEELGIGRPSTYAPTISTIQKRNYVQRKTIPARQVKVKKLVFENGKITEKTLTEKQGYEKNKLVPTDMGFIVTDFLTGHFSDILDYNFTAQVEEEFDRIARGEEEWKSLIRRFYEQFEPVVEKVEKESKRAKGERLLGVDPETGQKVYVKYGPYGPMVQLGESLQKTKPRYASLLPGMSLMDVTLEEALELLKLPKKIGEIDGEEVVVGMGKFGPYVRYQNKFFNIPPHINPLKINLEDALAVIRRKQGMDKPLAHVDGQPVVLSSGRYGPYLKWKGLNIPIPKGTDPHSLQEKDIRRLIEAKQEKDRQNTLRQWPEGYAIRKGGWGRLYAYAPDGKKKILPKNTDPEQWTLEQVRQLFNKTK